MGINRRSFLQKSATGSVALTVAGSAGVKNIIAAPRKSMAWTDGMRINPNIDNRKVVCCYDEKMVNVEDNAGTFARQNSAVDTAVLETDMDKMAMRLSGATDSPTAWATIFRKPENKAWGAVKAAIKINGINVRNMPRVAVVGKVCKELIVLGVEAENITVYDACHGASGDNKYTPYIGNGLPAGIVVSNGDRNGTVEVGTTTQKCTTVVSEADILVNCAVNKGHGDSKGGFTLTMKNHTGTMKFSCPSATEMINQNKSDLILGGSPVRQQLCIVDTLWASVPGPSGSVTHIPCRIVMGTLGALVDVAVARKIREPVMNATHNDDVIRQFCSGFGYTEDDIQWDEFNPGTPVRKKQHIQDASSKQVEFMTGNTRAGSDRILFSVPSETGVAEIDVFNLDGAKIRKINVNFSNTQRVFWDKKAENNQRVASGTYIVSIRSNNYSARQRLTVYR